ncbi:hypothetical protein D3C72_1583130 [compost metagenome]
MYTGATGCSPEPGSEMPRCASRLSPGPLTTQPITATCMSSTPGKRTRQAGACACSQPSIWLASDWKKVLVVRPQPGQAVTLGVKARSPIDCRICCATSTSRVRSPFGSGVSDTRIVSPMPCCSSTPIAVAEATMPLEPMPASVRPRCSG